MLSRKLFLEVAKVINLPLELTKRLSDNRENGMGGLLFPVLDKEKSFHAIFGLEWGVCAWIWSWPGMTKGVSIGTVPFRFLLAALELLISTPHSLVYFLLSVFESLLLRARFFWADFLFDMRSGKVCSHCCLHWTQWVTKPRRRIFAQSVLS